MRKPLLMALLLLTGVAGMPPAFAQLPPPPLPPIALPPPPPALGAAGTELQGVARGLRDLRLRELTRRFPREIERGPRGAPIARSVIVALSPSAEALRDAQSQGFSVRSDETLPALEERVVTLVAPRGVSTRRALDRLRRRDPGGRYDFSHFYLESGEASAAQPVSEVPSISRQASTARIGLVDSGVRRDHPALARVSVEISGCAGRSVPATHGTAIASLLVGNASDFHGAAPGALLFAADAWCGEGGPGGRVEEIARALAWLVERRVSVINLSLVGPPNVVLEALVRRVQSRGIVLVAAAGNDGPSAAPLYPAAYPGVVAVTAVDARRRALLEAARGKHVQFAAPGADMLAAALTPDYAAVRGTSFAAPLVAGLLAQRIASGLAPEAALDALSRDAIDLGRKGRDDVYGRGLVAQELVAAPVANK